MTLALTLLFAFNLYARVSRTWQAEAVRPSGAADRTREHEHAQAPT